MRRTGDASELRRQVRAWRREGRPVGLIPTMGALHEGHLSLVRAAVEQGWATISSVFVNPLQFGPGEDLERYPRDLEGDAAALAEQGLDLLFSPETSAMFPDRFQTHVHPGALAEPLCGAGRPGHFRGVTTVVSKLFHLAAPDHAVFGQKDFQQARVLQQMVVDLNFDLRLHILPTVREADGLALSSRNRYLSPAERRVAPRLHQALRAIEQDFEAGQRDPAALVEGGRRSLEADGDAAAPIQLEYLEVLDDDDLGRPSRLDDSGVAAIAARLGGTRLIDNLLLGAARRRVGIH